MPVRIAIGLAVTVLALAIAGRRFFFLFRLVKSGRPTPGRFRDAPARIWAELSEVAGQRKLLQEAGGRPGPLLHHVGLHHPAAHDHRGLRGPVLQDLRHPGDRPLAGHRVHRGLLRLGRARVAGRLHRHPAGQLTQARGAGVAVLRLPPGRRLDHPGHDHRGHAHPPRLPGGPDEDGGLPLRPQLVDLRLARHRRGLHLVSRGTAPTWRPPSCC